MPLNILKAANAAGKKPVASKAGKKLKIVQPPDEDEEDEDEEEEAPPPKKTAKAKPAAAAHKHSILNTGTQAAKAVAKEEAIQEQMKADRGKSIRFRMQDGEERTITFLDGDIGEDGYLAAPNYYEHSIQVGGRWRNFACTAPEDESQPCPICELGNNRAALVSLLTIIDHTPYEIKNGPSAGETRPYTVKLFACKNKTVKALTKIAIKRGGSLAGCTFDVSRTGDKEPAVGNQFDFTKRWGDDAEEVDWGEFAEEMEVDPDDIALIDYDEEIVYHTPEELVEMGIGKKFSGIGTKKKLAKKPLKNAGSLAKQLG